MNYSYVIGAIFGIIVGVIAGIVVLLLTKKDKSLKYKFDERQEIIRGRAFKYAFFTVLIYDAVGAFLGKVLEQFADVGVILFLGIVLGVLVCSIYCIWNEGYFSLNANPKRVIIMFIVIAVCNLLLGIRQVWYEGLFEDGKMIFLNSANLICGLMALVLLLVFIVKQICKKREAE